MQYKTTYASWNEEIIELTKDKLVVKNQQEIEYYYKDLCNFQLNKMAKRYNEESPIGDVLKQFISQNKLEVGIDQINVREAWKNLMGNGVNNYTTEIQLKGSTLYVALSSAVLRES